jgi:transcriptional repressor NrdR
VIKRDGTREQFDREKLKNGIVRSCQKRPVTTAQVDAAIDAIENDLRSGPKDEITSTKIGQLVMKYLKKLDKVAYIRFASVYLDFKDPEDFESAMKEVMGKK